MSSFSDSSDPNAETIISGSSGGAGPVPGNPALPTVVGYDLLRQLHHGGQGVVFEARQQATRRSVAIKFMHAHAVGSEPEKARFEREIQILGQLRHPGIVSIHDSGMARGSFYYVMDFIDGKPLDVYIAAAKLDIEARIELFAEICDAVHAAHLAGVIHRDLKPNNILVDEHGKAHVLDFGLAKVSNDETSDLTAAPAMTMTGQFFGSLPWASPEQAEAVPSKIDLRSDVYSLGVILYQLLTDRFPYEVTGNMRDTMENILHAEPRPPSAINTAVDDELETITLKCLSKERDRRYQIAGDIARDMRHYLAGEPIEAKRDSNWYVLKKTLRRYRIPVLVSCAFLVLLIASLAFTANAWRMATEERDRALLADKAKEDALDQAREQAELAKLRAAEATRYLHAIQVGSALAAIQDHDWNTAERLIDETGIRAREGSDLRSFAWQHVSHRLKGHAEASVPAEIGTLPRTSGQVLSPDGALLIGWRGPALLLHDVRGQLLGRARVGGDVKAVAFSPDGQRVVVGTSNALLSTSVSKLKGGDKFRRVRVDETPTAVAIDNSGLLAYGTARGTVSLVRGALFGLARDLLGNGIETCAETHSSPIRSLSFQSELSLLAAVSWERRGTLEGVFGEARGVQVKVWRIPTLRDAIPASVVELDAEAARVPPPDLLLSLKPQTKLTQVTFSPDEPILAAWGGAYVRVWSLRLIEQKTASGDRDTVAEASPLQIYATQRDESADPSEIPGTSAAWSADGRQLMCGDKNGEVQLFDVTRHPNATAELHEVFRGQCADRQSASAVAFVGEAPAAIVVGGKSIKQWNLTSALPYIELPGSWDRVHFGPQPGTLWALRRGSGVLSSSQLLPEPAQIGRFDEALSERNYIRNLPALADDLRVFPDDVWISLQNGDGLLRLDPDKDQEFRINTRGESQTWFGAQGHVLLGRRERDGRVERMRMFDVSGGELNALRGWNAPAEAVRNLRFSRDGGWLLGESADGKNGWAQHMSEDAPSFKLTDKHGTIRMLGGHSGSFLVGVEVPGKGITVRLHNAKSEAAPDLVQLPDGYQLIDGLFSESGNWVCALVLQPGMGPRVMVWDMRTGNLQIDNSVPRELLELEMRAWCAFTPDDELLAVPGSGQIRLVDLRNGQDRLRLRVDELPTALRFAPDGTALAAVLAGGKARIYLADTNP